MEEAVRTSLLSVVFSIQTRGTEGGKGKVSVASLSKLHFPSLGRGGSVGGLWGGLGSFSDVEMLQGEAMCSVRVWASKNSS